MDSGELTQMVVLGLSALAASVIAYTILMAFIGGDQQAEKRLSNVTESRVGKQSRRTAVEQANTRRKAVSDTLKDLEDKQKAKEKISLRLRLQRAGLDIPVKTFWIASVITGVMLGVVLFVMMPTVPLIAVAAVVFIGIFGLPRWVVSKMTARRQAKFLNEFANAIDVIVRGVKTGLPLNECLGIIARESPSPVREEFQELVEQQRIGIPLGECFDRMIGRVPLPEVKFFAIVIGIQQQAGGNLSEALNNLSGVLRDRKGLAAKVQALSSEAKASAFVLGSLPFAVMTLVYLSTPGYITLLWSTKSGVFMLLVGAFWMFCGVMVMRKMINFKY